MTSKSAKPKGDAEDETKDNKYAALLDLKTEDFNFEGSPTKTKKRAQVSKTGFRNNKINSNSIWGWIFQHPVFDNSVLVVIISNAIWIGVDVDWNHEGSVIPKMVFRMGENIFTFLFSVEIVIHILAYYRRLDFFWGDRKMRIWNWFDTILVVIMVCENWALPLVLGSNSGVAALSSLRLLRLLRISRIFRIIPELGMMVKSMLGAVRGVSSTFLLAIAIMYVFAIVLTTWAKTVNTKCLDGICFMDYFGTLGKSLLTLMQVLVYDDTFEIIRPVMTVDLFYGFILIFFILVASFTVLNMLIGVICDVVSSTTAGEREKLLKARVEDLFHQIDADGSGTVSSTEFENKETLRDLEKLGIQKELLENAFDVLDVDGDNDLEAKEFIRMIFKLLHPPETQDVLVIHQKIDRLLDTCRKWKLRIRDEQEYDSTTPTKGAAMSFRSSSNIFRQSTSRMSFSSAAEEEDQEDDLDTLLDNRFDDLRYNLTALEDALAVRDMDRCRPKRPWHQHQTSETDPRPQPRSLDESVQKLGPQLHTLVERLHVLRSALPLGESAAPLAHLLSSAMSRSEALMARGGHFQAQSDDAASTYHEGYDEAESNDDTRIQYYV
eukprot:gnl/MRDRNA2_/MRDRNA2_141993_c0_seq1.p1 gnl/MRDRNA2_/MRDRNA2_141993_c0~~gnl/MRDRNA2_/MRDRNA2_141993_c0_seq1.p1  ORF type:complete len:607 (-),score=114.84 gnl/MRDRNA2_/MRDRNA2_141993_c0_seq1:61-1881(-)